MNKYRVEISFTVEADNIDEAISLGWSIGECIPEDVQVSVDQVISEELNNPYKCPGCDGPADNGHDREFPPNAYYCTKCERDL